MNKSVLIVDDSLTMLDMLEATLAEAGYRVVRARDGLEALTRAASQKFDCVITDLNMPVMNGFELVSALRAGKLPAGAPILMLTTETSREKRDEARRRGATGWLSKPFDPQSVVQIIRRVCN